MSRDCLFCKILSGEIPSDKVLETDEALAFRDINPQAPVHILVIPKRHLSSVTDLTPEEAPLLSACFQTALEVVRQERLDSSGFRLLTNHGAEAGQSVFHLHFHILGGRRMRWPPG